MSKSAKHTTFTQQILILNMKYIEADFRIEPASEAAGDVLCALLGDAGFEAFEPREGGVKAYVQDTLWNEDEVKALVADFPMPGVGITYAAREADYENWNQSWELEGFEPIVIDDEVCIHDTRHPAPCRVEHDIVINPRMAFGSGTHPTTQMLLATLTAMNLDGLTVMDAGCGTGVLGILALKRGAKRVVAYDIDEWSTTNAAENFLLNDFHEVNILLGDASVVRGMTGIDLVLANINRNILLADMPTWVATLSPEGQLLVSGFYEADVLPLVRKATELGMELIEHQHHNEWQMLHFRRA